MDEKPYPIQLFRSRHDLSNVTVLPGLVLGNVSQSLIRTTLGKVIKFNLSYFENDCSFVGG